MEGAISLNGNTDIVINYIEKNRAKVQETMKTLETMSKKVSKPAIELADRAKDKLKAAHKGLVDIDKKVFTPAIQIADKTKGKIKSIEKNMLEFDKKVLSPIIQITGGDKSKLKFVEDGLKALDKKIFKPAIELVDGTKNAIKSVKSGLDFLSKSGTKIFDMMTNSATVFSAALDMAKAGTLKATLAQWGFNSAMLANPVTWIVVGVIALIAAIILLVKNWDRVKQTISGFITWFKGAFSAIGTWLSNNWKKVVTAVLLAMGPVGWAVLALVRVIRTNWNSIRETAIAVWNTVAAFFTNLWDGIKNTALTVWKAIGDAIGSIGEAVKGVWNGIMEWFSQKFEWVRGFINELLNNPAFKLISDFVGGAVNFTGKVISGFSDWALGKDVNQAQQVQLKTEERKKTQLRPSGSPVQQYGKISRSNKINKASVNRKAPDTVNITIPKLADSIIVREKEDIDRLAGAIVGKLKQHSVNMGVA